MRLFSVGILIVSIIQFLIFRRQKQRIKRDFIVLSVLYTSALCITILDLFQKSSPARAVISWFQPISDWVYRLLGG